MGILDLVFQDNLNPKKVSATNGGEYHSPCPGCGGKDRFIIWPNQNRYFCRRCEKKGDAIQYLRDFHKLSFKEACEKLNHKHEFNNSIPFRKSNIFKPSKLNIPEVEWQKKAFDFVSKCNENLLNSTEALSILQKRGLSLDSIKKFQLGWNPISIWENWLAGEKDRKIWIPKGIVIPAFKDNQLIKIKVRRSEWSIEDKFPKYIEVHGSMPSPSLYGTFNGLPIIILESELDAILIQQEAGIICSTLALGGATKKPDEFIDNLFQKVPLMLFSLDYDEAGVKAYKWWKKHYRNLFIWPAPFEKSIGDAFIKGLKIKKWVLSGIKEFSKLTT